MAISGATFAADDAGVRPAEEIEHKGGTGAWVDRASSTVDMEGTEATYWKQSELVVLPRFIPMGLINDLISEVRLAFHARVRRSVRGYKHSESIGATSLRELAPGVDALYRSPQFIEFLERLTDAKLQPCPAWDAHASAVYHYAEPGDACGAHYDTSWYRGVRYTVLIGLVNDSTSRLVCEPHKREPHRPQRRLEVATEPGTMVVFNGDKLWHWVSPLGEGEARTVLTLQYVTNPTMGLAGVVITLLKDALAYFGWREVARTLRQAFRRPGAAGVSERPSS